MPSTNHRREFIRRAGALSLLAGAGLSIPLFSCVRQGAENKTGETGTGAEDATAGGGDLFFKISLAQWSLHRTLQSGALDNLDFPAKSKELGIDAVEFVNQFFKDKARDKSYLAELKKRCDDQGVRSVRIMIDEEGDLGDISKQVRDKAVENHYKWVEAAQFLGCTDIRVNAAGKGSAEEVAAAAADGLGRLTEFARDYNIAIIVENHGGYSSNAAWLAGVMKAVNNPGCGTLPDFGNFCITRGEPKDASYEAYLEAPCLDEYDKYKGVEEMMPFAKGVSAKSYTFDEEGNETGIDYARMLQIVKAAGYRDYIGIEYEGAGNITEEEGILKTLALLKKVGGSLS